MRGFWGFQLWNHQVSEGPISCINRRVTWEGALPQNHPFGQPHVSSPRKGSCRIEAPQECHRHHRPLKTNSGVQWMLHDFGNVWSFSCRGSLLSCMHVRTHENTLHLKNIDEQLVKHVPKEMWNILPSPFDQKTQLRYVQPIWSWMEKIPCIILTLDSSW